MIVAPGLCLRAWLEFGRRSVRGKSQARQHMGGALEASKQATSTSSEEDSTAAGGFFWSMCRCSACVSCADGTKKGVLKDAGCRHASILSLLPDLTLFIHPPHAQTLLIASPQPKSPSSSSPAANRTSNHMSDGNAPPSNVGTYLARRLINIGIREFYAVPGKSCLWLGVHS